MMLNWRVAGAADVVPGRVLAITIFLLVAICATAVPFRSAASEVGSVGVAATVGTESIATVLSVVITATGVVWVYFKNLTH